MDKPVEWTQWVPPYGPRQLDGGTVMKDEHGRMIEHADCGRSCPGCGVCCAGHRDEICPDYAGVEGPEENRKLVRGGLVKLEEGLWYRIPHCGERCPGYGRCCQPVGQRDRPETVADARRVLLEDGASPLWQMQEALVVLAHEGSAEAVEVLEAYMPRAHARLAGFAECALDEGRYMASVPHNDEEARIMMMREVRRKWEDRAAEAYGKIEDLQEELEQLRYEVEVAERLLAKVQDEAQRQARSAQASALRELAQHTAASLADEQAEMDYCHAMIAEIEADLGEDKPGPASGGNGSEPF